MFESWAHPRVRAGAPCRVAIFGDCGTGNPAQAEVARQVERTDPDLVCIPGDITYPRGRLRDYRTNFESFYNAEPGSRKSATLARTTPFVAAPGNHDLGYFHRSWGHLGVTPDTLGYFLLWSQPLNGPLTPEQRTAALADEEPAPGADPRAFPLLLGSPQRRQAWRKVAGPRFPRMTSFSFDYGCIHWTVVDSNERVDWSDPRLLAWLDDDLRRAQGAAWRFVMYHHPPYHSSTAHAECRQMQAVAPLLERGGVDVV